MTAARILILLLAGLAAGFINVVAGGGSLLTLPALIFLGLPASVANGTNRVAIVGQNLVAMATFRHKGFHDLGLGLRLSITAVLGAVLGSSIAVTFDDELFKKILSVIMLLFLVGILLKKPPAGQPPEAEELRYPRLQVLLLFLIGIYGGFIQAGVGYLLIVVLSVIGNLSLVRANSLKVIVVAVYMIPSLIVFIVGHKVAWIPGLVLTAGNGLGGWLGSTFSIAKGDRWIRLVLTVAVLAMASKLMGLF